MNKFEEKLGRYHYGYSEDKRSEISIIWLASINVDSINCINFLSSKYALAVGETATFMASKYPFLKSKWKVICRSVENTGSFYTNDGDAFEFFSYALFKDINGVVPTFERTVDRTVDATLQSIDTPLEVKTYGLEPIHNAHSFLDSFVSGRIFSGSTKGTLYFDITFENQRINEEFLKGISGEISYLLDLLKTKDTTKTIILESMVRSKRNFCLIKLVCFPSLVSYLDFWGGHDRAGLQTDAPQYYLSTTLATVDFDFLFTKWCKDKEIDKKSSCVFVFTIPQSVYDSASVADAYDRVLKKFPAFKCLCYVDLWEDTDKLAAIDIFSASEDEAEKLIGLLDPAKVSLRRKVIAKLVPDSAANSHE